MTIDQLADQFLVDLQTSGDGAGYIKIISSGRYTNFATPRDILEHLETFGLISRHKTSDSVYLSPFGKQVMKNGGWLKHLEQQELESSKRLELSMKADIGSHRSGLYAVWAFWLSIVALVGTVINSLWPGLAQQLVLWIQQRK